MTNAAHAASHDHLNRPVIVQFDDSLGYIRGNVTVISAGACAIWESMSVDERKRVIARASAKANQGESK
jgi:hypothetical protein